MAEAGLAREHRFDIRIYYEDTDAAGIVYHAAYLRFAERARTEALRALGLPHAEMARRHDAFLVVRRIEVEYASPARLDDLVTVRTRIRRVGAVLDLDQDVLLQERLLAALRVRLVCVAGATLRPRPIPEPWRSVLRARIAAPDATPPESAA
ncbi:MAG: tol-pal system-associated acyl-CoA thioesterase [Rhodovarius sp.]|nr:tol-pal system-associated acyl-CoA thioesterase [Rhodovarius sp.]MCX7931155.1 tol-pal system-associated acyl-CoA thioesterase [Rhodovarius sp.]MDW8315519.1 tol-pal system-associated acyl-CoA thioesterase [Rhodovarius sp.]